MAKKKKHKLHGGQPSQPDPRRAVLKGGRVQIEWGPDAGLRDAMPHAVSQASEPLSVGLNLGGQAAKDGLTLSFHGSGRLAPIRNRCRTSACVEGPHSLCRLYGSSGWPSASVLPKPTM